MSKIFRIIKKFFITSLVLQFNFYIPLPCFSQTAFSQLNFIKSYPKIISINKDGFNDKLFLNYNNDEGKNLILKIYDTKGVMILEEKISNSVYEKPETDGSYSVSIDITNVYNDLFNIGTYIYVLVAQQKVLVKGSFAVVK